MARILPLLVLAGLAGCAPDDGAEPAPDGGAVGAKLVRFEDCDALRDWVAEAWTEQLLGYAYGYGGWPEEDAGGDGDAPTEYSETNVQEVGVDEPDLVKTDGEHLYVTQWTGELTIVDSWPAADTTIAAHLPLEGWPASMFLDGDRALVFSTLYDERGDADWRWGTATRLGVVDVTDRTAPAETRQIDVEGWLVDARRIEGDVYVVLQSYISVPEPIWSLLTDVNLPEMDWSASAAEQELTRAEARRRLAPLVGAIVDGLDLDELLPRAWDHAPGEVVDPTLLLDCIDVYHPAEKSEPQVLSVVHLDLRQDGGGVSATGLLASGWTVYASAANLYVAQSSWAWWDGWTTDWTPNTRVHRFALAGADTVYEASGEVDGYVLNRWSMDERDNYLRVATSDGGWADEGEVAANHVFVLGQQGEGLAVVGALNDIAPGEQIYAARFMEDYGFLVTFEQVDPLFTLDLRDPTAPALVGELEVPGYSSYLHPLDGGHLLAVGMDAETDGTVLGFQASLFDVTDLAAPTQLDRLLVTSDDWSWSEALWDAHAFTYFDGVMSVPVYTYDYDETTGAYDGFSGLWVVDVGDRALAELGRVDHSDLVEESACLYSGSLGEGVSETCPADYWYAGLRRSVVIEDYLYSVSDYGIKVSIQRAPDIEVARVVFWPLGPM